MRVHEKTTHTYEVDDECTSIICDRCGRRGIFPGNAPLSWECCGGVSGGILLEKTSIDGDQMDSHDGEADVV